MNGSLRLRSALAAGAAGAVLAGLLASPGSAGASGSYSDWPMFRTDPGHSGVSPETAIGTATAGPLAAGWTATLGTSSYDSPAVATSAVLGEAIVCDGANSHFYAYPADGGNPIWTFKTGKGGGSIDTSPAVYDGVVYFGSTVGTVYALDADTGALLCSYSTGRFPRPGRTASPTAGST